MSVTNLPSSTAMMRKLDEATTGLQESLDVAAVVPRRAVREAREATDRRARWFWLPLVLVAAVSASALTATVMYFVFGPQIDSLRVQQTASVTAAQEVERIAREAAEQAALANAELLQRGQATVPVPPVGVATDADVLVSAATARVLAALPDAQPVTAGAIAAAVADYVTRNPITPASPTAGQIADSVAAFLIANPPAAGTDGIDGEDGERGERGEKGETGEPGRPPTADEIRAALDSFIADNPIPPCPSGTALQQVRFGVTGPDGLACVFVDE